jgi:hypothetical protein
VIYNSYVMADFTKGAIPIAEEAVEIRNKSIPNYYI